MPQIDDLVLFTQVIEQGSFSKVAEANKVTKSVVSKRISRLEEDLGVQLIFRTTRKLTLTEAGEMLFYRAKGIAQTAKNAFDTVTSYSETLAGHIKMSVPTISGELLLARAVAEFCEKHPGLTVDMSMNNDFVDLVADGYDLVIRTGHLEDSSLIARHIFNSRWMICASPEYLVQQGEPQFPEQLAPYNCLGYTCQTSGAFNWLFTHDDAPYNFKVSGNFSSNNAVALKQAAIAGKGLAYLPKCLVYKELDSGELVEVLSQQTAKVIGIYAVYPYTRKPAKKVQLLIEHIRACYLEMKENF